MFSSFKLSHLYHTISLYMFESAFSVCIILLLICLCQWWNFCHNINYISKISRKIAQLVGECEKDNGAGATEPFLKSSWFPRYLWAFFHCTSLQFLNFSLRRYVHRTHRDFKLQQSRWCTWSSRLSKVAACTTEIPVSRSAVPDVLLNKTTGSQKGPRNENIRGTHEGSLCKAWDCSSSWLWHRDFPRPSLEHLWNYVQRF